MIVGVGTDIAQVKRFEKFVDNATFIDRFFNEAEKPSYRDKQKQCEHYASRFAAKEAFAKALGTGLVGFEFSHVYIQNGDLGKPELIVIDSAKKALENRFGIEIFSKIKLFVSISHEKEYATAVVVIDML